MCNGLCSGYISQRCRLGLFPGIVFVNISFSGSVYGGISEAKCETLVYCIETKHAIKTKHKPEEFVC